MTPQKENTVMLIAGVLMVLASMIGAYIAVCDC
jgi:hypothetical protein